MTIEISERAAKVCIWLPRSGIKHCEKGVRDRRLIFFAAQRLRQITSAPPQRNTLTRSSPTPQESHLRVTVTAGGCHGFQYLMSLEDSSKIDKDEDTIFSADGPTANGGGSGGSGSGGKAQVVLDQASLELLKGSTIDFTTELIGSQFKIVGNPRAKSSCGCGTSFDVD